MSEIKIDQQEIDGLVKNATAFIEMLTQLKHDVGNKDEDLFVRYMAYCRLNSTIHFLPHVQKLVISALQMGHDIHDPMLQTPKCKESGWDAVNLECNNFFIDETAVDRRKGIEIEINDVTGELKEKIKALIMEAAQKPQEVKH